MTAEPGIICHGFRAHKSGSLQGFAVLEIVACRLKIEGVGIHQKGDHAWCSLPRRPQLDRDGRAKRGDDGKVSYTAVLSWSDRTTSDRFNLAAIAAVDAFRARDRSAA